MLIGRKEKFDFYENLFPNLKSAFDFLRGVSKSIENGKYEIDDGVFALVTTSMPRPPNERILEAHRKYVDLQYILDGYDVIGLRAIDECKKIHKDYDEATDLIYFADKPEDRITVKTNHFALLLPEEAHATLSGDVKVKRVVIKIAIEIMK